MHYKFHLRVVKYKYHISSIRRLGINQQIVCCVPTVKRSKGVNLNAEF